MLEYVPRYDQIERLSGEHAGLKICENRFVDPLVARQGRLILVNTDDVCLDRIPQRCAAPAAGLEHPKLSISAKEFVDASLQSRDGIGPGVRGRRSVRQRSHLSSCGCQL